MLVENDRYSAICEISRPNNQCALILLVAARKGAVIWLRWRGANQQSWRQPRSGILMKPYCRQTTWFVLIQEETAQFWSLPWLNLYVNLCSHYREVNITISSGFSGMINMLLPLPKNSLHSIRAGWHSSIQRVFSWRRMGSGGLPVKIWFFRKGLCGVTSSEGNLWEFLGSLVSMFDKFVWEIQNQSWLGNIAYTCKTPGVWTLIR